MMLLLCVSSIAKAESKEPEASVTSTASPKEENQKEEIKLRGKAPLYFATNGETLVWKRTGVAYDFRKNQEVEVGNYKIKADSFKVSNIENTVHLLWDSVLVPKGQLSIFDKLGNTVLTQNVAGNELTIPKDVISKWTDQQRLRFCVKSSEEREFSSLCSAWYGVGIKGELVNLKELKGEASPQLIIQNEERSKKNFVEVTPKEVVQFFVRLKNEITYEFVSQLPEIDVLDLVKSQNGNEYQTVFFGGAPLLENKEQVSNALYSRRLPIGARLWSVKLSEKQSSVNFQGNQGGIFTYEYTVQNPPKESDRVYISENYSLATYNKKDKVSYVSESGNGTWEFQSPEHGWTRVEGDIGNSGHKSYLDIYRGNPGEVGLRIAALMTTKGDQAIVGEAYAGYWFNSVFSSENYYFSRQRWGLGLNYLSALSTLSTEVEDDIKYSNLSVMLKYKVKPGIAYHDSSWGIQLGYTQSVVGDFDVPLMGAGLFLSSQLPKPFGDLLEKISIFRKLKWIGVEGIYHFSSLDSEVALNGSFILSAYLRTFVNNSFYWELSGGYRDNSFSRDNGAAIKLNTVMGSLGVGMSF